MAEKGKRRTILDISLLVLRHSIVAYIYPFIYLWISMHKQYGETTDMYYD